MLKFVILFIVAALYTSLASAQSRGKPVSPKTSIKDAVHLGECRFRFNRDLVINPGIDEVSIGGSTDIQLKLDAPVSEPRKISKGKIIWVIGADNFSEETVSIDDVVTVRTSTYVFIDHPVAWAFKLWNSGTSTTLERFNKYAFGALTLECFENNQIEEL